MQVCQGFIERGYVTRITGHVAPLLALKPNWFDILTVKQWEIMLKNYYVLLLSATNEETPYEQLLHYWD